MVIVILFFDYFLEPITMLSFIDINKQSFKKESLTQTTCYLCIYYH